MTILAAHQPQYLPWLGFFDKMAQADVFVLLDDVQFKKNEWQNRNRIKTADGWQWLTVPVRHRFPQTIAEVAIRDDEPWRRKHLRALESSYRPAPFFEETFRCVGPRIEGGSDSLADLNVELIRALAARLGIETRLVLSSELAARQHPTLRLVDLCVGLGAGTYLSGAGGDYLEHGPFDDAGVEVVIQSFEHPEYAQLFEGFQPYLSVVDLLMNCGDDSLSIIESGRLATP